MHYKNNATQLDRLSSYNNKTRLTFQSTLETLKDILMQQFEKSNEKQLSLKDIFTS